jgi:hypothetical protein
MKKKKKRVNHSDGIKPKKKVHLCRVCTGAGDMKFLRRKRVNEEEIEGSEYQFSTNVQRVRISGMRRLICHTH